MRTHLAGLQALLAPLPWELHVTDVPEATTYPYMLLIPPVGNFERLTLCNGVNTINDLFDVVAVGETTDAVLEVVSRVQALLVDAAPVVAGFRVDPIRHADTRPVTTDREARLRHGFPKYSTVRFRYSANPT